MPDGRSRNRGMMLLGSILFFLPSCRDEPRPAEAKPQVVWTGVTLLHRSPSAQLRLEAATARGEGMLPTELRDVSIDLAGDDGASWAAKARQATRGGVGDWILEGDLIATRRLEQGTLQVTGERLRMSLASGLVTIDRPAATFVTSPPKSEPPR